jgi:iron complex transport system ATP-binding protein
VRFSLSLVRRFLCGFCVIEVSLLTIDKLKLSVGDRVLLHDFTAQWEQGSVVSILGANGSGKTTLLKHITGVLRSETGHILWRGEDILKFSTLKRANRIASIGQHESADLETTVEHRIGHGLHARRQLSSLSRLQEKQLIEQIAIKCGIHDLLLRPLFSLSGGQRKKVHIARCLVNDRADLYVLDEPDASLDPASREHVMTLFKEMAASGKLVIAALHHRDLAERFADVVVEIGQSMATGSTIQQ